jgi:hypothetical protein
VAFFILPGLYKRGMFTIGYKHFHVLVEKFKSPAS